MYRVLIRFCICVSLCIPALSLAERLNGLNLQPGDQLSIEGPIELSLSYASQVSVLEASGDYDVEKNGNIIRLIATTPARIAIEVPELATLNMIGGKLKIKVQGNERLTVSELIAPEVHLHLVGRSRFDAELVETDYLFIALTEQGKASLSHVSADLLELDMAGHGGLNVAGEATRQHVELSDYAHYDAGDLQSEDVTVALSDYSAGLIQTKNQPVVSATRFTSLSAR